MNFFKGINSILVDDTQHNVRIVADAYSITVYLMSDIEGKCAEDAVIPVRYDVLNGLAYINSEEFFELFDFDKYDLDKEDLALAQKIISYMEENEDEIIKMLEPLDWGNRVGDCSCCIHCDDKDDEKELKKYKRFIKDLFKDDDCDHGCE